MKNRKLFISIFLFTLIFLTGYAEEIETDLPVEEGVVEESLEKTLPEIIISDMTEDEICAYLETNKISRKQLNQKDENGYTPLYWAIDVGKENVLNALIKKGANKNQITNLTIHDETGRKILRCSPVLFAAWKGDVACLEALMSKGSKLDIESDFIIPDSSGIVYIRLLNPIDAAFYNRRNIDFETIHKQLATKELNYSHVHYSGRQTSYTRVLTRDLLKEYDLLEIR